MNTKNQFNVIVENVNTRSFEGYNIIPYLKRVYDDSEEKPRTFEEYKEFILRWAKYQWWSRCEYEIILKSWPTGSPEKKIDIYWQILLNIDLITEVLMKEINGTES